MNIDQHPLHTFLVLLATSTLSKGNLTTNLISGLQIYGIIIETSTKNFKPPYHPLPILSSHEVPYSNIKKRLQDNNQSTNKMCLPCFTEVFVEEEVVKRKQDQVMVTAYDVSTKTYVKIPKSMVS